MAELLFEIRSGEIPAHMQKQSLIDLKSLLQNKLEELHLEHHEICTYVGPRRLVAVVDGLPLNQPDRLEERKGPRLDAPAQAIDGFLKSTGKTIDQLEERETPKGKFYFDVVSIQGQQTSHLIPDLIRTIVKEMPWPKNMTWGNSSQTWIRPITGGCCVFNNHPIHFDLTLNNDNENSPLIVSFEGTTVGHRFLSPQMIPVKNFEEYQEKLKQAFVIVDPKERQELILKQIQALCQKHNVVYQEDRDLLEEVTGLVEWPVSYIGQIEDRFMPLPPELLSITMRVHQRYFTLRNARGHLDPHFIVVANLPGRDQGKTIITGNERVLRARFADADFYYHHDLKLPLLDHAKKLGAIVFHAQLGSMAEKASRLAQLTQHLTIDPIEQQKLNDASRLCKADLVTNLVREFPDLQGIIGSYYAKESGYSSDICQALYEQYMPRGPNDSLPSTRLSLLLNIADRLDTLTGFFSVGIKPTGSKDPFALRRTALGLLRILEENFDFSLKTLFRLAYTLYEPFLKTQKTSVPFEETAKNIDVFLIDRLKVYWRDQGFPYDYVNAILAKGLDDPICILKRRLVALHTFLKDSEGEGTNLLSGYRRATNIVRIESEKDQTTFTAESNPSLFEKEEERDLFKALLETEQTLITLNSKNQFPESMVELAKLRPTIDRFFDHVTVNAENPQIRLNRLNLLAYLKRTVEQVADFSQIEGS